MCAFFGFLCANAGSIAVLVIPGDVFFMFFFLILFCTWIVYYMNIK